VDEAGSEEAFERRGGGRDGGCAGLRRHRRRALVQEVSGGDGRSDGTDEEVHAGWKEEAAAGARAGWRCTAAKRGLQGGRARRRLLGSARRGEETSSGGG
jgi:hypothetical protein